MNSSREAMQKPERTAALSGLFVTCAAGCLVGFLISTATRCSAAPVQASPAVPAPVAASRLEVPENPSGTVEESAAENALPPSSSSSLRGRLALSLGAGQFGRDALYSLQFAFFPSRYYGLEAGLSHNPSSSIHAALHHFGGVVPLPAWGRLRLFATTNIGTIQVFPGTAVNAKSVTKLTLGAGGGANLFLRDDIALRFEGRSFTVIDQQEETKGTLGFAQWSIGLTFFRALANPQSLDTGAGQ